MLGCGARVGGYNPTPAVDVDGNVLATVGCLDLRPDLPLIDLISKASRLLGLAAGGHRNLLIPNRYVAR